MPPLRASVASFIHQNHPFFTHSRGQAFLFVRDSAIAGRVVLLNPVQYNQHTGRRDVRLYLPEAVSDDEVWDALFATARQWAEKQGATRIIGPVGISPAAGAGILVDGFEPAAAMTLMPWHHRWYHQQFERHQFVAHRDHVSYYQTIEGAVPESVQRVAAGKGGAGRFAITRPGNRREVRQVAQEIGCLYNESWQEHGEYGPLNPAEIERIVHETAPIFQREQVITARSSSGELAGFILSCGDLSRGLQRSNGYLGVRTLLDLQREKHRTTHLIVSGLGVSPKYQHQGVLPLLYQALVADIQRRGIRSLETTPLQRDGAVLGGQVYKRHRVYTQSL